MANSKKGTPCIGGLKAYKTPYEAETAYIRDADSDGKVEEDEIKIGGLRYWDFGRDTEDEAGQHHYGMVSRRNGHQQWLL